MNTRKIFVLALTVVTLSMLLGCPSINLSSVRVSTASINLGDDQDASEIRISNAGSGQLEWVARIDPPKDWLSISVAGQEAGGVDALGTGAATINVTADRAQLLSDSDNTRIIVRSVTGMQNEVIVDVLISKPGTEPGTIDEGENEGESRDEDGEPASEDGEPASEDGEPASEEGEPASEEGEPGSDEGEPPAEEGEATHEEGEPPAEEGEATHEEGEPAAGEGEAGEGEGDGAPSEGESAEAEATVSMCGDTWDGDSTDLVGDWRDCFYVGDEMVFRGNLNWRVVAGPNVYSGSYAITNTETWPHRGAMIYDTTAKQAAADRLFSYVVVPSCVQGRWIDTLYFKAATLAEGFPAEDDLVGPFVRVEDMDFFCTNFIAGGWTDDAYEQNDFLSAAYDLSGNKGQWLSSIDGPGYQWDNDWYRIEVAAAGARVNIACTFAHAAGDVDIALYSQDGTRLALSESEDDNEQISVDLSSGGELFVAVYFQDRGNAYDLLWDTEATSTEGEGVMTKEAPDSRRQEDTPAKRALGIMN